jgi:GMP synthase (glutamine-hydrolysing)
MTVLIIVHVESEGPGSIGSFLESAGVVCEQTRLFAGDGLPADASRYDAVISMGGSMNVYQEEEFPFLRDETHFLARAINDDVPVLGVCLGAQMIAKACGASVTLSPKKEVGWGLVGLTDAGKTDPLFHGLPSTLEVLQWHEDMFQIPQGGTLLADGTDCPHQAFRYRNAFGLQFHVEVTNAILADWFADLPQKDEILRRHGEVQQVLATHAETMYRNFAEVIRRRWDGG